MDSEVIERRLHVLKTRPFRAKFHLGPKEKSILETRGLGEIRQHANNLLSTRLFPAPPYKDGKQTPYRGHPVFVAQHATATCCRTCLMRWHKVPKGRAVTPKEQDYILNVIETWLLKEASKMPR